MTALQSPAGPRVLVVGAGWRFTSGISYYTCRLSNALGATTPTRAMLMRRLVPRALYPGRARVGSPVNRLTYDPAVPVYDGIDWYWGRSMRRARQFFSADPPDVLVLQWWTGAVLHSYLRLVALARQHGTKVIVEWHEVQDTGEARIPGTVRYVKKAMARLLRHVDGHIVHSQYDLELLQAAYGLPDRAVTIVPHGPYDHHTAAVPAVTPAPQADRAFNFLYFGVIRPYKGVEDLVAAFDLLPESARSQAHLTIVGETWEGWDAPLQAVRDSPYRDRITVVNRYVTDAEIDRHFAAADAGARPYRRSSSSGPLHIAMSSGLPVLVSSVGGLVEAAGGYEGTTFVPPQDPGALAAGLQQVLARRGHRYADPHSWDNTTAAYAGLFDQLGLTGAAPAPVAALSTVR